MTFVPVRVKTASERTAHAVRLVRYAVIAVLFTIIISGCSFQKIAVSFDCRNPGKRYDSAF